MRSRFHPLFVAVALCAAESWAAVEGRVIGSTGTPIEHARVEVDGGKDGGVYSDSHGEFALPDAEPPVRLLIEHPRFLQLTLDAETAGPLEIVLEPKQEVYEVVAVTANRGEQNFAPVSVAISVLDPTDSAAPAATLAEVITSTPAVSENGQGGIFQTYSIRGVSRQRVMTLISGMRIVGERRAGVSASFIDPGLMDSVDVLRGPSSTYYGSGALGGVVQLFPQRFEGWAADFGFDGRGDELRQLLGWGKNGWTVGIAHRDANNAQDPTGAEINSAFTQTSGSVGKSWTSGKLQFDLLGMASAGRNIGKANTDFPERTTIYPEENHLLLRFGVRSTSDWELTAYAHPNDLETEVSDDESVSRVLNEASDFGFGWSKRFEGGGSSRYRFGVDYFGRRSVDALEEETLFTEDGPERQPDQLTLDGGEEDEAGIFGAGEWNWGKATILAGGRYAFQRQQNADLDSTDDGALTGFAGVVAPVGGGFELVANLGTGLRFPSLSERFFTGTTGRGFVVGNPALDAERSLNVDAGVRWYGQKLFLSGYIFRNEIDDYIERIEVSSGQLSFVNLTSGTIEGVELEGLYQLTDEWNLSFGGHTIEGRAEDDEPLADIPPASVFLGGRWSAGRWSWDARWETRSSKDDPGSGEKEIPSANLVSMALGFEIRPGLEVAASGRNLLDEEYFNSADRRVPLSADRRFALSIRWRQ